MEEDVVVCLRKVQVLVDGIEETAVAAYWIIDGEDCCRVGFLQRHMVAYMSRYDDALAQVTRVLGTMQACLIPPSANFITRTRGTVMGRSVWP